MITTNFTGNLGNHLWQYASTRSVAESKNYDWGFNNFCSHDYYGGKSQFYFMDVDFGKQISGITKEFNETWDVRDGTNILTGVDEAIYNIEDNTHIYGYNKAYGALLQSEDYLWKNKNSVKTWFGIKSEYKKEYDDKLEQMGILLDENMCILNLRGGEYRGIRHVLLINKYWEDGIRYMLNVNPKMKFICITDDTELAKSQLPGHVQVIHQDVGFDFYVVNSARYIIIANSSFAWWAAWLSNADKIIAPFGWWLHNTTDGKMWACGGKSRKFNFLDREGNITEPT